MITPLKSIRRRTRRPKTHVGTEQLEQRAMLTTFFVSHDGSDDASGSADDPFGTIQQALDHAASVRGNDIIRVEAGEYSESLTVSDQSGTVVVNGQGEGITIRSDGSAPAVSASGVNVLGLRNMTLTNGSAGLHVTGRGIVSLLDVTLTGNTEGARIEEYAGRAYFSSTTSKGNEGHGLRADTVGRLQIQGSTFADNGGIGILSRTVNKTLLHEVVASGNGHRGMHVYGGRQTYISQSSFDNNGHDGVRIAGGRQSLAISGMTAIGNRSDGLDMDKIAIAVASEMTITGNRHDGIEADDFQGRSYIEIGHADVSGNGSEGVTLKNVKEMKLSKLSTNGNGDDGVDLVGGHKVLVTEFHSEGNERRGVNVYDFQSVSISEGASVGNAAAGIQVLMADATSIDAIRSSNNTTDTYGGGVYVAMGGDVALSNATVTENSAEFGGGLYVSRMTGLTQLVQVEISGNKAVGEDRAYGGGIYTNSALSTRDTVVRGNSVLAEKAAGGGIYVTGTGGRLSATTTTIASNTVEGLLGNQSIMYYALGGGAYVGRGATARLSGVNLVGNSVAMDYSSGSDDARSLARGGGLYKNGTTGSAVHIGDGSRITGNSAEEGGGVYGHQAGLTIAIDSVFADNQSLSDTDDKGGVWEDV